MTRAERVLAYLSARPNTWVAGMELMTAEVGGTRAGGRMLELKRKGHRIESRPDPLKRSNVWQYRLVVDVKPEQTSLFGSDVAA